MSISDIVKGFTVGLVSGITIVGLKKVSKELIDSGKLTNEEAGVCALLNSALERDGIEALNDGAPELMTFAEMVSVSKNVSEEHKAKLLKIMEKSTDTLKHISNI